MNVVVKSILNCADDSFSDKILLLSLDIAALLFATAPVGAAVSF